MKKAIVTAGSRGIGKAISDSLKEICDEVISPSSSELDTSNLRQVDEFISKNPVTVRFSFTSIWPYIEPAANKAEAMNPVSILFIIINSVSLSLMRIEKPIRNSSLANRLPTLHKLLNTANFDRSWSHYLKIELLRNPLWSFSQSSILLDLPPIAKTLNISPQPNMPKIIEFVGYLVIWIHLAFI